MAELTVEEQAELIADYLFRNGTHREADRLLLVKEDLSCSAQVTSAEYLGGWSKQAVINSIMTLLKRSRK